LGQAGEQPTTVKRTRGSLEDDPLRPDAQATRNSIQRRQSLKVAAGDTNVVRKTVQAPKP
jgi:hypothetical protein